MREKDDGIGWVREWVQKVDEKHDQGHTRLRTSIRDQESDISTLRAQLLKMELAITEQRLSLTNVKDAPIDIGKVVGNWRVLAVLALAIATNLVGNWYQNSPIRESQVKMENAFVVLQSQVEGGAKIQTERTNQIKDSVDALNRQMEMRRLEIQALTNEVQQLRRGR